MDIVKLVSLGKLEEFVTIGSVRFKLTTPTYNSFKKAMDEKPDAIAMLVDAIVEMDGEAINTPELKTKLAEALVQMQGNVITQLVSVAADMMTRQNTAIQSIIKKE